MKSGFNENQQEDLKRILGLFVELLKLSGDQFVKTQILVSQDFARIAVLNDAYDQTALDKSRELLGETSVDYMTIASRAASMRSEVAKIIREVLRKLIISGAALYGSVNSASNAMIIEFGLQPNDPLGAEAAVIKLLARKKYENQNQ